MSAALTDHLWRIAELVERALAEVPSAKPLPRALALSNRTTSAARELPKRARLPPRGRLERRPVGVHGGDEHPR
jgi:hypothetical protein